MQLWNIYKLTLERPDSENPFKDVQLLARFEHRNKSVEVRGFYDGSGAYKIRFMPDEGEWIYSISSNIAELHGESGGFSCTLPGPENHGPVHVDKK